MGEFMMASVDKHYLYKKIGAVDFGLLSPQLIKKMAVVKIVTPELYDREGFPVDGGLMDLRMGVIDPGLRCKTCGSRVKECVGHFGYISLARPVIHIKYINRVYDTLRATCRQCGRLLLSEEKIEEHRKALKREREIKGIDAWKKRVKLITTEARQAKTCPHCKAKQPKITLEKPYTFYEDERRMTPVEVRAHLEKIPDGDAELLGFNPATARPEWMVLTVLPIPPVTMRPSITLPSGERSEDDLTHKLGDIVRINQRLFEHIYAGAPEIIIEDLWDLLQYHVTTYFDNSISGIPTATHRTGQPLKTLAERIKGKDGRIRNNLAGKRTNFSARTVISPDPMIAINEVGVPLEIAMKLTVPERVTEWNIDYLKEFVKRGPKQYPGANYIIRPDGRRRKITEETIEQVLEELQPGYIVERHLMNGDISLFNRQPSLHRNSMMAHRIRILPGRTFRLNPNVCAPYNADFDGDEMNLHIPQTEEAMMEAEVLMSVENQLNSPKHGLSVIGLIQDAISGLYLLTSTPDIPRDEALRLLSFAGVTDYSKLPTGETVHGRDVFSVLLPDDFSFTGKDRLKNPVKIRNGRLVEGVMDKANLGEGAGLMLRMLNQQYGPQKAMEIIGRMSTLGIAMLLSRGFTISTAEMDIPKEVEEEIQQLIREADERVEQLIREYEEGTLKPQPGKTARETLEALILHVLNEVRNRAGELVYQHLNRENHVYIMARSGARGNIINIAQIAGLVGQQAMRGARMTRGYRHRTLSCFKKHDLGADAHGFIRSSFRRGLKPHEFFFQSIAGIDSLMDTALRTPHSGYLYRRLVNALQDVRVEYDGTVRDAARRILQFQYGEDGIDVAKSEGGRLNVDRILERVLGGEKQES